MENKFFIKVKPIIVYPQCMKSGNLQDCHNCSLQKQNLCKSPRSMCVRSYRNHKRGCPNYGKRSDCPPNVPMFDQMFDTEKPVYAIFSVYDLNAHVEKMRQRHPNWTESQLYNVLYWQGTAKKDLRHRIAEFYKQFQEQGYLTTTSPEAMGIDVTQTMHDAGISLEWPAKKLVYKIAMAGIPLDM